jgi:hypothetical protein
VTSCCKVKPLSVPEPFAELEKSGLATPSVASQPFPIMKNAPSPWYDITSRYAFPALTEYWRGCVRNDKATSFILTVPPGNITARLLPRFARSY